MATKREVILTLDRDFSMAVVYDDVTGIVSALEITNNHPRRVVVSVNGAAERSFLPGETTTILLVGTLREERFEFDPLASSPIQSFSARLA